MTSNFSLSLSSFSVYNNYLLLTIFFLINLYFVIGIKYLLVTDVSTLFTFFHYQTRRSFHSFSDLLPIDRSYQTFTKSLLAYSHSHNHLRRKLLFMSSIYYIIDQFSQVSLCLPLQFVQTQGYLIVFDCCSMSLCNSICMSLFVAVSMYQPIW